MTKIADRVFLVGPMGAGKTTIGRLLAKSLKMKFVDSDQEIEDRCGADISWIFDVEGEPGFRVREEKMIEELTGKAGIVLATGGGAVLSEASRRFLNGRGTVVYLLATVAQQLERTARDSKRPLLQDVSDPGKKLGDLMSVRDPLYREVADYVIQTGSRSPRSVCNDIVDVLSGEGT